MKAIITGVSGQDGAYLAKSLVKKGYTIIGVVRKEDGGVYQNFSFLGIKGRVDLVKIDLKNFEEVSGLIKKEMPDEIYHLAAVSSVGYSFQKPFETLQFNLNSTLNVIESIRKINPQIKFFNAVSSEAYGNVDEGNLPITEETLFSPVSPYGVSKASSFHMIQNYRRVYGLWLVNGIMFNHESVLRKENFVTKKIISSAIRASRGEEIFFDLGNLSISRDWGYAPDYVEGMWKSLQVKEAGDYIFATGEMNSLKDFLVKVFEKLGLNYEDFVSVSQNLYRKNEILKNYGDPSKTVRILDWNNSKSFDELIERLISDELEYQSFQGLDN